MPLPEKQVFVCLNQREPGAARPSCRNSGSKMVKDAMKDFAKEAGLGKRVRINDSGCLDQCEHGPVAVVYPDNVWYSFLTPEAAKTIVQQHLVGGSPVESLELREDDPRVQKSETATV